MSNIKDESLKDLFDHLGYHVTELVYADDKKKRFSHASNIAAVIHLLEEDIAKLEADRDRQKEMASKLRKLYGEIFSAECDAAGIK